MQVVAIGLLAVLDVVKKSSLNHPPEMSSVMSLKRIDQNNLTTAKPSTSVTDNFSFSMQFLA